MNISTLFREFTSSEKNSGGILIACSIISLIVANTGWGENYIHFWHSLVAGKPIEFWINDGLMTIFFLLVGLEIEREFYIGELSDFRKALLPVLAAVGGMLVPAFIHLAFNYGKAGHDGFGIPMATDIAFSLAILALLGDKVPVTLKVFLTALAIIDDLGAIMVIAIFYTTGFSIYYFAAAVGVFGLMLVLNRLKFHVVPVYLVLGIALWYLLYSSGIHATISGVLLAFALPFGKGDEQSPSYRLQHRLHLPVAFFIVPLFALANTAIAVDPSLVSQIFSANSIGIILGLVIGKPLGIFVFSIVAISLGWCSLPENSTKQQLLWTGMLAGIGFTMSIFITLMAFDEPVLTGSSKLAIIIASTLAAAIGYFGLKRACRDVQVVTGD